MHTLNRLTAEVHWRRSPVLRYAFAGAVGKRFHSERLTGPSRNQIIEHHRSVQWAETEYIALLRVVQENSSLLREHLGTGVLPDTDSSTSVLFADYCNMLRPSAFVPEREMLSRLDWQ